MMMHAEVQHGNLVLTFQHMGVWVRYHYSDEARMVMGEQQASQTLARLAKMTRETIERKLTKDLREKYGQRQTS
jgi:hypothetical protein